MDAVSLLPLTLLVFWTASCLAVMAFASYWVRSMGKVLPSRRPGVRS